MVKVIMDKPLFARERQKMLWDLHNVRTRLLLEEKDEARRECLKRTYAGLLKLPAVRKDGTIGQAMWSVERWRNEVRAMLMLQDFLHDDGERVMLDVVLAFGERWRLFAEGAGGRNEK